MRVTTVTRLHLKRYVGYYWILFCAHHRLKIPILDLWTMPWERLWCLVILMAHLCCTSQSCIPLKMQQCFMPLEELCVELVSSVCWYLCVQCTIYVQSLMYSGMQCAVFRWSAVCSACLHWIVFWISVVNVLSPIHFIIKLGIIFSFPFPSFICAACFDSCHANCFVCGRQIVTSRAWVNSDSWFLGLAV